MTDSIRHRVQVLDAKGNFKFAFGKDVVAGNAATGFEICSVASQCQQGSGGSLKGEFWNPGGIAIDQSDGSVYVWDRRGGSSTDTNARIQKFDAAGNFVLMFGKGVNASTGGDVCTQASGDVCRAGTGGSAPGQLGAVAGTTVRAGIAVDPTNQDVLVADPANRRFQRFTSAGAFVAAFGSAGTGVGQFGSSQPQDVAVDSRGIVYLTDSGGSGRVQRYDAANANGAGAGFLAASIASAALGGAGASLGLRVDPDADGAGPDEDILYVLRDPSSGNTAVRQYGPVNDPGLTAAPAAADAIHAPTEFGTRAAQGLGLNADSGTLYVGTDGQSHPAGACEGKCNGVFALDDDGTDATVDAQVAAPLDVTATGAELSGTVDPGRGVARYRFEISADGSVWTPLAESRVEGTGPQAVSATATGLDPNSDYRARLFTRKILSPAAFASDTSSEAIFLTDAAPPAAITSPVGPRTDTSAELRASLDPNGTATTYWFEYGPTAGYGTAVPVPAAPAGSGNEALALAQQVAGLLPGTTYHYRVVADGFGPPVFGADQAFTTLPAPQPQPQLGDRGYELVSPADKLSGVGVGQWYSGRGSFIEDAGVAAYDAERFAAQGRFGANLLNGAHGYANDWAFAERVNGEVGWRSHSPITHPSSAISFASFLDMQSTSENLSSVFWGANNTLALFPELAASEWTSIAPGALSDWGGASPTRWELMGPRSIAEVSDLHQADKQLWDVNFSADGTKAVGTTALIYPARLARVVGLAGPGDPTNPAWGAPAGDLVSGRSVYVADLAGGLADSFAGTGQRPLANVCTGAAGVDRTVLPGVDGTGKLAATECPAPLPGRDARLLSDRGATAVATRNRELVVSGNSDPDNAVSADGSRSFFLSPDPEASGVPNGTSTFCEDPGDTCPPQLYVRQENTDGSVSVRWISMAAPGLLGTQDPSLTGSVRFEGATPDGDKVFFRTNSPLTADDPNGGGAPAPAGGVLTGTASGVSWDLYMYDLPDGPDGDPLTPDADPADGTLTRVSAGPTGSADCNSPLPSIVDGIDTGRAGALRFLSDDGRRAYFTCAAPLAGVPASEDGTITAPGGTPTTTDATNLYAYDAGEPPPQRWRFVARLPRPSLAAVLNENLPGSCAATAVGKGSFLRAQDQKPQVLANIGIPANCVRGTADGAFITLWSTARLTADDPASGETGDVYAYDAERARLVRITAPQGGPGGPYECAQFDPTVQGSVPLQCFGDGGADYKGELDVNAALGLVTDPANRGDRVAFFQSGSRLVPGDTDDAYDVYQWRNGTLSLLTPGTPTDAFYKGNDRDGRNVYFATRDALTWQDFDSVADVYTARIGGGIPEPPPPPSCDVIAGACQPAGPVAPSPPSPNSAGFADAGNVAEKPVRKAKKKKHKAKKKHGKKGSSNRHKAKRSNATRRAGK